MFRKWVLVVSVVSGLVAIPFGARNVRVGFTVDSLSELDSDVPRQVSLMSCWNVFVCRTFPGHNFLVEEKLEFERGEDVSEEEEKFCYLGDMIICCGGASEVVIARSGSVWKKFRELVSVLVGKQGLSLKQRGKLYQCYVRPFCCTFVKRGNLLLWMRRVCVGWSIV